METYLKRGCAFLFVAYCTFLGDLFPKEAADKNSDISTAHATSSVRLRELKNACLDLLRAIDAVGGTPEREPKWSEIALQTQKISGFSFPAVVETSRLDHIQQLRVAKVIEIFRSNLEEPPTLQELGRRVGCSHCYLSRLFVRQTGKTISAALRDLRLEKAALLLREGKKNVTEVALEVGYSSFSHFSMVFRKRFDCCPKDYR